MAVDPKNSDQKNTSFELLNPKLLSKSVVEQNLIGIGRPRIRLHRPVTPCTLEWEP